jgi:hypothetical protein
MPRIEGAVGIRSGPDKNLLVVPRTGNAKWMPPLVPNSKFFVITSF